MACSPRHGHIAVQVQIRDAAGVDEAVPEANAFNYARPPASS